MALHVSELITKNPVVVHMSCTWKNGSQTGNPARFDPLVFESLPSRYYSTNDDLQHRFIKYGSMAFFFVVAHGHRSCDDDTAEPQRWPLNQPARGPKFLHT